MIKVVDNDIGTLATVLYVEVDDMLRDWLGLAPGTSRGWHWAYAQQC
jgi:hypothetical protein